MTRQDQLGSRTGMPVAERRARSALNQIIAQQGLIHGTLIVRKRRCGKPSCRCAKGQLHESLYLVVTENGKGRQMYVPSELEAAVRRWIEHYAQARRLMDDLSALHWDKVRNRQG